jgi:methionine-rich copper-binding protein CopC
MSNRHQILRGALSAAVLLLTLAPAVALGHAELATASPADKSTVSTPPTEIVFTFSEPVVPAKSSLKLVDASGKIVADGSTVDPTDPKTMRLAVSPQPPGTYTVRWTTASALDGDIAHGTTTFTIAAATPSPSQVPSASPSVAASEAATPSPSAPAPSASPSASGDTGTQTSTSDAVIPVIAALLILGVLGLWLLRSRSRRVG